MVGSLGATSINFERHHREIPLKLNSTKLIKSTLIRSYVILRRVLDLYNVQQITEIYAG